MRAVALVMAAALALSTAPDAVAQTNDEVNAGIQFNFNLPGARSLALGGAFLALADDATAAYANPAGLTILTRPEISLDGRTFNFTSEFTNAGHAFGPPSGNGIDAVAGVSTGTSESDTSGLSFASFVYPGKRWVAAIYYSQVANFESDFSSQGAFFTSTNFRPCQSAPNIEGCQRLFPVQTALDLEVESLGLSLAYRFGERFSLGAGFSRYDFRLDSTTTRFAATEFFGPPNYDPSLAANEQAQSGEDNDYGFNFGFLWRGDKWSLGGVYRSGPEFDFVATNTAFTTPPAVLTKPAKFRVPEIYGLGLAFRPTQAVTISFDWNRVGYSSLSTDLVDIFLPEGRQSTTVQYIEAADVDEFRLGFEYLFATIKYPLAIRVGSWLDPDHRLVYGGPTNSDVRRANAMLFREGDDDIHITGGLGMVFGAHFELNVGVDVGDRVETGALSAIFRF